MLQICAYLHVTTTQTYHSCPFPIKTACTQPPPPHTHTQHTNIHTLSLDTNYFDFHHHRLDMSGCIQWRQKLTGAKPGWNLGRNQLHKGQKSRIPLRKNPIWSWSFHHSKNLSSLHKVPNSDIWISVANSCMSTHNRFCLITVWICQL